MATKINGKVLADMIVSGANLLYNNKKIINDLNVFPVPDGDTGTNMSLTMDSAKNEVLKFVGNSVGQVAESVANASLRGARGNSGVILSQLFRGIAKGLKGLDECDIKQLALAFKTGVDTAYKAVMKPTEGTILTVARESADALVNIAQECDDIETAISKMINEANESLKRTPELLPVLKQAGVVDSGGKGYICILEGMYECLKTGNVVEANISSAEGDSLVSYDNNLEDINFTYCTEFIINKQDINKDAKKFRSKIENKGDSMLVIDDTGIVKVHIHTNNPGFVIEEALKIGMISNIKIDNMKIQHQEIISSKPKKDFGFVSVAVGDGIVSMFKELGADEIIEGGQTMNPSADDILKAISKVNADTIFVLPNNKNIILAANQAKELSDKNIVVIPTLSVPQGVTAMLSFDGSITPQDNEIKMTEALSTIKTGQVTYAVRDTSIDDMEIKEGDILGVIEGKVKMIGKDITTVSTQVVDSMVDEDSSVITIFYGKDVAELDAMIFAQKIEEKYPDIDALVQPGGQPLYYYIISVE